MKGQWLAKNSGTNTGEIIINFDELDDHFEGICIVIDDNKDFPILILDLITPNKNKLINLKINKDKIFTINPKTFIIEELFKIKESFPKANCVSEIDLKIKWTNSNLKVNWKTDLQTNGFFVSFSKSKAGEVSELIPEDVHDWKEFKKYILENFKEKNKYIFRGQDNPIRLRTSYHRLNRANLVRYRNVDVRNLLQQLSAKTKHYFNIKDADEFGSFLSLVQHHGYPTPMLDWTYSPFVATFFAFQKVLKSFPKIKETDKVRIFIFDNKEWMKDFPQPLNLLNPYLYLSYIEPISIENDRMVPQQAVSTVTNVDDIESYIKRMEILRNKKYLRVIDLPRNIRKDVMDELSLMGINAGALFPGLDGACEALKERFFDI